MVDWPARVRCRTLRERFARRPCPGMRRRRGSGPEHLRCRRSTRLLDALHAQRLTVRRDDGHGRGLSSIGLRRMKIEAAVVSGARHRRRYHGTRGAGVLRAWVLPGCGWHFELIDGSPVSGAPSTALVE